jgi:hypothetical protein
MKFDIQEVAALLHIHEKASGHPRLKPLVDATMKHLEEIAEATAGGEKPEESFAPMTDEQAEDITKRSA